jgi:hypothetical protein
MARFLIHVTTAWCGMDQDYAAIADNADYLEDIAQLLAYDNFSDFDCLNQAIEEEYPDVDSDDITEEMKDAIIENEGDYYGYTIEEWDETRPEEEWDWYDLQYDSTKKSENAEV